MKRLRKKFYERNTIKVARDLLGKFLIRIIARPHRQAKLGGQSKKKIIALITETEAYHGPKDLASHASRGRTKRTEVMFGLAGRAYVYLIYGMYYCFNIVTGKENFPAAVLIRGVEIINNLKPKTYNQLISGPGKVCRELKIDRSLNKENLLKSKKLFVVEDKKLLKKYYPQGFKIKIGKRVGVDYAGEYRNKPWRFILSCRGG